MPPLTSTGSVPSPFADRFSSRLRWEAIDPAAINALLERARAEDLEGFGLAAAPRHSGDVSSALLPADVAIVAELRAREDLVVCGLPLVTPILGLYGGGHFVPLASDGQLLARGQCLGTLHGPARHLLSAERVILNFLQHLSGIASLTARYVEALGDTRIRLLDTRKTIPGYRVLHKYAVATGGGWNHRMGLFDRVMLKDNHLAAGGSTEGTPLAEAARRARAAWPDLAIEAEVDGIRQIPPLLEAGVDILLLDNFDDTALREALALIDGRAATEASGGITLERLPRLRGLPLDFISTGATVHQSVWKDIGMDIPDTSA
ncbi:MAG: carboxylating nicotinate-nucleotide diphosphorylase [Opitutales bacterium]|nr:carboxylating nicotinate-nucleotide diphosphorylase [Opitutales bacterium]